MAGDEREALAKVADRLCVEFGYPLDRLPARDSSPSASNSAGLFAETLSDEDKRLIAAARQSLAQLAGALQDRTTSNVVEAATSALLDGAEMVMRSELALGNPPSKVMPSLVFLIALSLVDQDEALDLSKRTAGLLAEAIQ